MHRETELITYIEKNIFKFSVLMYNIKLIFFWKVVNINENTLKMHKHC